MRRTIRSSVALGIVCSFAAACAAAAAAADAEAAEVPELHELFVDDVHLATRPVEAVELLLRLADRDGDVQGRFHEWQVEVREDGRRPPLDLATLSEAGRPVSIAIVLDPALRSERAWPGIARTLERLGELLPPGDRLALLSAERVPRVLAPPLSPARAIEAALDALVEIPDAPTRALLDGVRGAFALFDAHPALPRRRAVVMLTAPGSLDHSRPLTLPEPREGAPRVAIFAMLAGEASAGEATPLRSLARQSGGPASTRCPRPPCSRATSRTCATSSVAACWRASRRASTAHRTAWR